MKSYKDMIVFRPTVAQIQAVEPDGLESDTIH